MDAARLHRLLRPLVLGDVTLGKADGAKQLRVLAGKHFAVDELHMAPLVSSPAWPRVLVKTTSPLAVPVEVHSGTNPVHHFFLVGAIALPKASALAEPDGVVRQHDWKAGHFPWPFWFVRRVDREEDANCSLVRVVTRVVLTCSFDGRPSDPYCDNFDVHIPVLTNTSALDRGDELTVWSRPQARTTAPTGRKAGPVATSSVVVAMRMQPKRASTASRRDDSRRYSRTAAEAAVLMASAAASTCR